MSGPPKDYVLGQGTDESRRLDNQHKMIVHAMGYLLHPHTASHITDTSCIADLASGTGNWMRDVAPLVPKTVTFHGYDISGAKYPSQDDTAFPSNITFDILDNKQPVPEKLMGKYDIVHVRLMTIAMALSDWRTLAENVYALLKPGGVFQWTEADLGLFSTAMRSGPVETSSTTTMQSVFSHPAIRALGQAGEWQQCAVQLPTLLPEVGFVDVVADVVAIDRDPSNGWRVAATRNAVDAVLAALRLMGVISEEEQGEQAAKIEEEIKMGAYTSFKLWTFVGKKPATSK